MLGRLRALALSLLVAGCATASNSLSLTELQAVRIETIEVNYLTENAIWWGSAEREYADRMTAKRADDDKRAGPKRPPGGPAEDSSEAYGKLLNSPEAKAYLKDKLKEKITQRLQAEVVPRYQGTRPVKLVVNVGSFVIPSAVQRAVLGGTPMMGAITIMQDARTGAELAKLDKGAGAYAGNGLLGVAIDQAFSNLEDRVLDSYVENVKLWLATPTIGKT